MNTMLISQILASIGVTLIIWCELEIYFAMKAEDDAIDRGIDR